MLGGDEMVLTLQLIAVGIGVIALVALYGWKKERNKNVE